MIYAWAMFGSKAVMRFSRSPYIVMLSRKSHKPRYSYPQNGGPD